MSLQLSALAAAHPAAETWVPLQFDAKYKQNQHLVSSTIVTGSLLLAFDFVSDIETEASADGTLQDTGKGATARESGPPLSESSLEQEKEMLKLLLPPTKEALGQPVLAHTEGRRGGGRGGGGG